MRIYEEWEEKLMMLGVQDEKRVFLVRRDEGVWSEGEHGRQLK